MIRLASLLVLIIAFQSDRVIYYVFNNTCGTG